MTLSYENWEEHEEWNADWQSNPVDWCETIDWTTWQSTPSVPMPGAMDPGLALSLKTDTHLQQHVGHLDGQLPSGVQWRLPPAPDLTWHSMASAPMGAPRYCHEIPPVMCPRDNMAPLSPTEMDEISSTSAVHGAAQEDPRAVAQAVYADIFSSLQARTEPALFVVGEHLYGDSGQPVHKQHPRFKSDLYRTLFIRGEGGERAGWCGFCSSWHRLKDSAYWYHLHYSHGVSCATGQPLPTPQQIREGAAGGSWEALCGDCNTWVPIGKPSARARTTYFRHAYKCQSKGGKSPQSASESLDI